MAYVLRQDYGTGSAGLEEVAAIIKYIITGKPLQFHNVGTATSCVIRELMHLSRYHVHMGNMV